MKITVNPNTEASQMGYVEAGRYTLRVVKCEHTQGANFPYLKWEFELADPNVKATDEKMRPGHVFENTTLKEDAQFGLRNVCEALGVEWGDFDTDDVIGLECDVNLGIKTYEGNMSNEVKKWFPKK